MSFFFRFFSVELFIIFFVDAKETGRPASSSEEEDEDIYLNAFYPLAWKLKVLFIKFIQLTVIVLKALSHLNRKKKQENFQLMIFLSLGLIQDHVVCN
jgi:hypothetical protein